VGEIRSIKTRMNYDKTLLKNIKPALWKNPNPVPCYNLVVIGAGTAGLVAAAGAAGLGAKVALIERDHLGGDCLNTGCVPSKGIIRAARAAYDVKTAGDFGITVADRSIDFNVVMERMRRIRAGLSIHDSAERFSKELGVDVFFGEGRFIAHDFIAVNGQQLHFKKAVICTGARASVPFLPGIEQSEYLTNETVFQLNKLPKRMAIIGGGPLGCELAQAFARLGSRVSILEQHERLLSREDEDAAACVHRSLMRDGVDILLKSTVLDIEKKSRGKTITHESAGRRGILSVDQIVIGAGRTPNVDKLDLEKADIAYDFRSGVVVNDYLRTSNSRVYAAGDVCSSYKFTHAADAMARTVIANALFMARQKMSALVIPWCTYTDPEIAHIGMNKAEAEKRGYGVITHTLFLTGVDRAVIDGETDGFARVHLKRGTDRILGATIVARHAGEMINELSLAMTADLGLSAIGKTILPYPTQAEIIKKLADVHNKTRLTPFIKNLFMRWLKFSCR
jgi:pyruvate/2-oxoglutarate dehydrogenase complex dihydrolipoamide dehydrogenase (E3) component